MIDSINYFKSMLPEGQFEKFKKFNTIGELLNASYDEYPNEVALEWKDGKKTYLELKEDVSKVRGLLVSKGIKKGDVVGIMFRNEYDFVRSFLAIVTLGAVSANMPSTLPGPAIFGLSHKFTLKAVIYNSDADNSIEQAKAMGLSIQTIRYDELDAPCDKVDEAKVNKEDAATIVFTGGTTGAPKGALLSHDNLTRGALNGCYGVGNQIKVKYLSMIPFTHVFGLIRNLLSIFETGSTLYMVKEPSAFIKEAMFAKPEAMVLVPALANIVFNVIKGYSINAIGGKLRLIIAGGAIVSPILINNLKSVGVICTPGYGLTESTNLVSGNANIDDRPASVGILYPGQETKVVNGELYIKGDNVFMGYFNDPKATSEVFEDGYLKTGDLVKFDDEGFLYIVGRSKNVIVFDSGNKVSPEVIEEMINAHPLVQDSVVYLTKNDQGNEILAAQVYPMPQAVAKMGLTDEQVEQAINQVVSSVNSQNADFEAIRQVIIRKEDFKRSPAMKILRNEI